MSEASSVHAHDLRSALRQSYLLKAAIGAVLWFAAIEAFAFGFPSNYYWGLGATAGINALLALGVIILTGYAGQFSLASSAFFAIGAYGSGLLTVRYEIPILPALVLAAVLAALVAAIMGWPIFRLRGHFLAMGTLAFAEIVYLLVNNLSFTGGASGFGGIAPIVLGPLDLSGTYAQFVAAWVLVGIATWVCLRLGEGREGRALRALRAREVAAASMGVRIAPAKTKVFVLGAVFGSVAGSFYAHTMAFVDPSPFSILASIDILIVAIIGGLYSPWGAPLGAIAFTLLQKAVGSVLPQIMGAGSVGAGESAVVAAVLVLVLVGAPRGLSGLGRSLVLLPLRSERLRDSAPAADDDVMILRETLPQLGARTDEIALECRAICRSFGGVKALQEVNVELKAGEILAIIGPNGAGKSTLINLISGVDTPNSGNTRFLGHDVSSADAPAMARLGLGRTFQTPAVFAGMTALSNVLVGGYLRGKAGVVRSLLPTPGAVREERAARAEARKLLAAVGMLDLADVDAANLSLGHAKKLELARALAMRPRVLLLDEPAAGLNTAEKHSLAKSIRTLRDLGLSILLVEHDMDLVMSTADRVQVLEFGRTLALGTPNEIRSNAAVISAYLGHDSEAGTAEGDERVEAQS